MRPLIQLNEVRTPGDFSRFLDHHILNPPFYEPLAQDEHKNSVVMCTVWPSLAGLAVRTTTELHDLIDIRRVDLAFYREGRSNPNSKLGVFGEFVHDLASNDSLHIRFGVQRPPRQPPSMNFMLMYERPHGLQRQLGGQKSMSPQLAVRALYAIGTFLPKSSF